jgi:hypothetical protein
MNQIEKARADFDKFYLDKQVELVDIESSISPSGSYELKIKNYELRTQNARGDRDFSSSIAKILSGISGFKRMERNTWFLLSIVVGKAL